MKKFSLLITFIFPTLLLGESVSLLETTDGGWSNIFVFILLLVTLVVWIVLIIYFKIKNKKKNLHSRSFHKGKK